MSREIFDLRLPQRLNVLHWERHSSFLPEPPGVHRGILRMRLMVVRYVAPGGVKSKVRSENVGGVVVVEQSVIDWCSGCACPFPDGDAAVTSAHPFEFAKSALPSLSHFPIQI